MILAVAGGKGGVGKSTVAVNLGAELDAVVVDADLGMADLPERRGPDLHDVLAGRATPCEAVREDGPFDLLPCGRSLTGARGVEPTEIVTALESVADAYGSVIVDCPAGMAADTGLPLYAAERCVVVTTPDRVAVPDALRTRALARLLDAGLERVVLNRAVNPPIERVARTLGAPVTAIPEHDAIQRARSCGQPVAAVAPQSEPAVRFRELAAAVEG